MNNQRLLNRPVKLFWAGWETDTYILGSQGWQISAEQDVASRAMRIAINHPKARIQGISYIERFLYEEIMNGNNSPPIPTQLRFEMMGQQVYVNQMSTPDITFNPVDPQPMMINSEITSLDDYCNFAPIEIPKKEVYLKEANMSQILEMALERQAPEQERIRNENYRKLNLEGMKMGKLHTELRLVG